MPEHYSAKALGRTKALYDSIRAWTTTRSDVSIIGGWAVYEHVEPGHAMQSRDVDIVLHTEDALLDLNRHIPQWNLRWRTKGGKRFPDAHFSDEDPLIFRLDVFTTKTNPTWTQRFGRQGAGNVKSCPVGSVPSLDWVVTDKLHTATLRRGADAADKRAKDLIDVYNLVFHNVHAALPQRLEAAVPVDARRGAVAGIAEAATTRPEYAEKLETLRRWLEA